jgi:PTS system nitrogen regulatory IIA component
MELADILSEESVIVCTGLTTKAEVLDVLASKAAAAAGADPAAVLRAVSEREDLGSTGLGNGIAIPHGKIPGIARVVAVFGRLEQPIEFDAIDDQPVDLLMLLLAPTGSGADHLKALARVARILRTDSVVEALRSTLDPGEIHDVLSRPIETTRAA